MRQTNGPSIGGAVLRAAGSGMSQAAATTASDGARGVSAATCERVVDDHRQQRADRCGEHARHELGREVDAGRRTMNNRPTIPPRMLLATPVMMLTTTTRPNTVQPLPRDELA